MIKFFKMEQFEFVRWFTDDDYNKLKSLISYHQSQNNTESQLTWFQSNSDEVIKMHDEYQSKECNRQLIILEDYREEVKAHNKKVDNIKNGGEEYCICGSQLKWREIYKFAGCSNWQDKTQKHNSYNYRTDVYEEKGEVFSPNYSHDYLSSICKIIKTKYNIKIQASNLYEFYVLNKVELLRDDINRNKFNSLKQSGEISKKRELLIKSILEQNKIKFRYQKQIMYKIKDGKQTHAIPDFIAFINNEFLIIEQKKNIDNCSDSQVEFYSDLLQFMYPDKSIKIVYVIEEDSESTYEHMPNYSVLTLDEFKTYISEL